jgi:hypothetical protein
MAGVAAGLQVGQKLVEAQHSSALLHATIAAAVDHKPALED